MKKSLFTWCLMCFAGNLFAQAGYWQQEIRTKIEVSLDDEQHMLRGHISFDYKNNAPDTLRYLYIHLWPNAYKSNNTAFAQQQLVNGSKRFYFAKDEERGFIDSLRFEVNRQPVVYFSKDNAPDIARIDLPQPLYPGQEITIQTPFRVKIPVVFSRLGHTGQAYFISQWFPKPAVYDRKGWHPIPYLDQGEFYSDPGSYDVSITLPSNYIVMATGNCLDAAENEWLDSLSRKALPQDTLYRKGWPASAATTKTLHFQEDKVHDFAWFADKRWIVRNETVSVYIPGQKDSGTVKLYTAFLPVHQQYWDIKGTGYLKSTINYYGKWVGSYPYKTIKAVEGDMFAGGGMEYPTVTIIDKSASKALQSVVVHEAGHNWFYGILATNERDYAWMDEGINTFYEQKVTRMLNRDSSDTTAKAAIQPITPANELSSLLYYQAATTRTDQALSLTSAAFTKLNYGGDIYYKTALMLGWLENYMGPENFEAAMHEYYDTWKHKHPYPEDLQIIMARHSPRPVDWFFSGGLSNDRPVDFSIKHVNGQAVTVKNKSSFSAPVRLNFYKNDTLTGSFWQPPFTGRQIITVPDSLKGWEEVRISRSIPDMPMTNNLYRKSGLFHGRGLRIGLLGGLNRNYQNKIYVAPALGYNYYDGFGLGVLLHNLTIPSTRFRFAAAPVYSFGSKTINGAASAGYLFYPKKVFREILLQTDFKSFHNNRTDINTATYLYTRYQKLAPGIQLALREKNLNVPVSRTITLKGYFIEEEFFKNISTIPGQYTPGIGSRHNNYLVLRYAYKNRRIPAPFDYQFEAQYGKVFTKLSLEGNLRIEYPAKRKALYLRAFAGKFFYNQPTGGYNASRYLLATTYTGVNDYLYDDTYLGRNERDDLSGRQVSVREGGFKIPTLYYSNPIGLSDNWLATLNIKTDLPLGIIPVRLYADIGAFGLDKMPTFSKKVLFEGGVEFYAFRNIISVYIPLLMSNDYKDYLKSIYGNKSFQNSITFTLQLHNINWLKLPENGMRLLSN